MFLQTKDGALTLKLLKMATHWCCEHAPDNEHALIPHFTQLLNTILKAAPKVCVAEPSQPAA